MCSAFYRLAILCKKKQKWSEPIDTLPWRQLDWRQLDWSPPKNGTHTVHYLWCTEEKTVFLFQHYLSVYSAVRFLRPHKVLVHYKTQPQDDELYNKWFQMLKDEIPGLELQHFPSEAKCGSRDLLKVSLSFLSAKGGVVLGQNVILTSAPSQSTSLLYHFSGSDDKTEGVIFAPNRISESDTEQIIAKMVDSKAECVSVERYNSLNGGPRCTIIAKRARLFPLHIMNTTTPFAELARWLFYGKRDLMVARPDPSNPIPRISHFVRFAGGGMYTDLHFNHYLSILSALYIARFDRVYLHVDAVPRGRWWRDLLKENVTLVLIDKPLSVFQRKVNVIQHQSDIARLLILNKYGGTYQDMDVLWAQRVPDSVLAYPAVVAVDGAFPSFPERFNNGVMMARRDNEWVQRVIQACRRYRDDLWSYDSAMVTYRMYELHPTHVLLNRRLQVLCHADRTCCPRWLNATHCVRDQAPSSPRPQPWREGVLSYHVVLAKPHPSLASPDSVKKRKDLFSELATNILVQSGRQHLLT